MGHVTKALSSSHCRSIPDLDEEDGCGMDVPNFSYESVQFTACRESANGRPTEQCGTADISSPQGYEVPVSPGVLKAQSATHATSTVSASTAPAVTTRHHAYESISLECITRQPLLKVGNAPGHPQLLSTVSQDDSEYELMESMQPRSEPCITAEAGEVNPQQQYTSIQPSLVLQEGDLS